MKIFLVMLIIAILLYVGGFWVYMKGYNNGLDEGKKFAGWEFYQEVARLALQNKAIYGTVEMGDYAVVENCLIISGNAGIEISGHHSVVKNCSMIGGFDNMNGLMCRGSFTITEKEQNQATGLIK